MGHRVFIRELASLSTRSGSGSCSGVYIADAIEGLLLVYIKTISGTTPTLDLKFEVEGNSGHWHLHTLFPTYSSTGDQDAVKVTNFGKTGRISWSIGGTNASFEFEVIFIGKT